MRSLKLTLTLLASFSLIAINGASSQTQRRIPPTGQKTTSTLPQQQIQFERTVNTQQRVNRYFHGQVIPKLKTCWSRIQGTGTVEIEHAYTKGANGNWVVDQLTVSGSTLPKAQQAVALTCMKDSTAGTSFPVENTDSGSQYVVKWTWPVPFPVNATQLTSAMFAQKPVGGGTSGGCDGKGTPAKCFVCDGVKACKKVCVGSKVCTLTFEMNGRGCSEKDDCASGGPFGVSRGGGIIF